MGVIVNFNYTNWIKLFPMFAQNVSPEQAVDVILPLAEQYCRNDGGGPVNSEQSQTNLLNLMVAHIAQLLFGVNGSPPTGLVGRISNASQGSVSVATEFPSNNPSAAWYNQTQFGAAFYQAMAPYRTMRYLPGNQRSRRATTPGPFGLFRRQTW